LSEASAAARRGPIAVLASPRARSFRAEAPRGRLGALEAATRRIGGLFAAVDDAAGTEAALSAARDAGAGLLAVAGGDGTLGHVLAAAVKVWGSDAAVPPLGLLRGGTMNTVANGLGIPRGDAVARLTHLADLLSRGGALPTRARPSSHWLTLRRRHEALHRPRVGYGEDSCRFRPPHLASHEWF
jgi:hypothetical protein